MRRGRSSSLVRSRNHSAAKPNARFARRRLEILQSAAAAFRRGGYHGSSVDSIARALHMRKGNLYYYFRSKEEILYFCHDYSLDLLLDLLKKEERSGRPPDARLRSLIAAFVHMIIDELHGTALTLNVQELSPRRYGAIVAKRDAFDRGIRRVISTGIRENVFRDGDPKLLTFAILGALNWIPGWFNPRGPARSEEIAKIFADYLVQGLLRKSGKRARG